MSPVVQYIKNDAPAGFTDDYKVSIYDTGPGYLAATNASLCNQATEGIMFMRFELKSIATTLSHTLFSQSIGTGGSNIQQIHVRRDDDANFPSQLWFQIKPGSTVQINAHTQDDASHPESTSILRGGKLIAGQEYFLLINKQSSPSHLFEVYLCRWGETLKKQGLNFLTGSETATSEWMDILTGGGTGRNIRIGQRTNGSNSARAFINDFHMFDTPLAGADAAARLVSAEAYYNSAVAGDFPLAYHRWLMGDGTEAAAGSIVYDMGAGGSLVNLDMLGLDVPEFVST